MSELVNVVQWPHVSVRHSVNVVQWPHVSVRHAVNVVQWPHVSVRHSVNVQSLHFQRGIRLMLFNDSHVSVRHTVNVQWLHVSERHSVNVVWWPHVSVRHSVNVVQWPHVSVRHLVYSSKNKQDQNYILKFLLTHDLPALGRKVLLDKVSITVNLRMHHAGLD